jgi:hypothetical protein
VVRWFHVRRKAFGSDQEKSVEISRYQQHAAAAYNQMPVLIDALVAGRRAVPQGGDGVEDDLSEEGRRLSGGCESVRYCLKLDLLS